MVPKDLSQFESYKPKKQPWMLKSVCQCARSSFLSATCMCWDNLFSFYVASSKVFWKKVSSEGDIEGYILFPITGVVHMPKKEGQYTYGTILPIAENAAVVFIV